jgi:hypothetical protein
VWIGAGDTAPSVLFAQAQATATDQPPGAAPFRRAASGWSSGMHGSEGAVQGGTACGQCK